MDVRKRKRGIRASREKLEAAMLTAGFETQADLAKQIAYKEGIEKPPKDLVNKVFREQAVSTHNLARIANALGVSAHTIYLAKDDSEFEVVADVQTSHTLQTAFGPQNPPLSKLNQSDKFLKENSHTTEVHQTFSDAPATRPASNLYKHQYKKTAVYIVAFLSLLGLAIYVLFNAVSTSSDGATTKINAPLGKVRLIVQAPNDMINATSSLIKMLNEEDNITAILTTSPDNYQLPPQQALIKWKAHAVLKMAYKNYIHYAQVDAYITTSQHTTYLLQVAVHQSELEFGEPYSNKMIVQQVQNFIDGNAIDNRKPESDLAFRYYIEGKDALFLSHSADSYQSAITQFQLAVQEDQHFSDAYAELCRAFARFSWIQDETESLEKAATYCNKAEQLAPQVWSVATARAELLMHTGEPEMAVKLINNAIEQHNGNADALAALAAAHLALYTQLSLSEDAQLAEQAASKALKLAPKHWHANNTLGNIYFAKGETSKAKAQFLAASKVVKHEIILANLGTLQMCFGELDSAMQTYFDVINNFQNNYIGYENLGSVYFFKQQYEKAAEQKLIAVTKQPEIAIHQVWSGLAEVYLRMKLVDKALRYYEQALVIVERNELLENANISSDLHKFYYQTKLSKLDRSFEVSDSFATKVNDFLEQKSQLGLKERSHLAWLAFAAQLSNEGQNLWFEISEVCPVYNLSPELLAQTDSLH